MSAWVFAMIIGPLLAGGAALLLATPSPGRRFLGALAAAGPVVLAGLLWSAVADGETLVVRLGGWLLPYGIGLVVDRLSALFLVLTSLTAFVCVIYGYAEKSTAVEHPLRLPLIFFLLAGVNLALTTADLFNLFVAFEVMLLASYALLTLESDEREVGPAWSYVALNLFGSAVFLAACGLAYGWLGTLGLADLGQRLEAAGDDFRVTLLGVLLLVVFATKAGIGPFFFWLPPSYPVLPPALAALFGGLLTKVGVYILLRFFGGVLPVGEVELRTGLLWASAATMVVGGFGALAQPRIQAILSWHIISQIGFMGVGVALGSPLAVGAAVAITGHNIIVKASLFLAGGTIAQTSGTDELKRTGPLFAAAPALSLLFLLQALSLAGVPPLSGFWGKLWLVQAGLAEGRSLLVFLVLGASFLTLASMLKIWFGAFWRPSDGVPVQGPGPAQRWQQAATGVLAAAALTLGLGAEGFLRACAGAAESALDRASYRSAVAAANALPMEERP